MSTKLLPILIILSQRFLGISTIAPCIDETQTKIGGVVISPNFADRTTLGTCIYTITSNSGILRLRIVDFQTTDGTRTQCTNADCCKEAYFKISNRTLSHYFCHHNLTLQKIYTFRGYSFTAYHESRFIKLRFVYTTSQNCSGYDYECNDRSACYNRKSICDNARQCNDSSDEMQCARRYCLNYFTKPSYFQCGSGKCIDTYLVNNGIRDCEDGSDENNQVAFTTSYLVFLFFIFSFAFFMVTCRWCMARRPHHHLDENLDMAVFDNVSQSSDLANEPVTMPDSRLMRASLPSMQQRPPPKRVSSDTKPVAKHNYDPCEGDRNMFAMCNVSSYRIADVYLGLGNADLRHLRNMGSNINMPTTSTMSTMGDDLNELGAAAPTEHRKETVVVEPNLVRNSFQDK